MSDPVLENSSLIHCLDITEKLISKNVPFKLDIKLPNGFVFNISWNDEKDTKHSKDLKKSPSTLERNMARKNRFIQEKKHSEKHKTVVKEKEIDKVIKCEKCNIKVNSKKQLESHKLKKHQNRCENDETMMKHKNTKHSMNKCNECGKLCRYSHELQNHMKEDHFNINDINLNSTQEEHDYIEKLLEECEKDMLDDDIDDEEYSDSESDE